MFPWFWLVCVLGGYAAFITCGFLAETECSDRKGATYHVVPYAVMICIIFYLIPVVAWQCNKLKEASESSAVASP